MNSHAERTIAEDLLARAAQDWVSAAEVIDLARRSGLSDAETLRDLATGVIARLLVTDMIVAGDVTSDGFSAWSCSAADAIARVAAEWGVRADPFVMPGEIVWLDTTEQGQMAGEAVWARESPQPD
jgi:hypothetical protein